MESKDKKNKKYYEAMALVAQTLGKDEKIKNAWLKEISSIIVICEGDPEKSAKEFVNKIEFCYS